MEMIPQSAITYMLFIVIAAPIRFAKAHTVPFSVPCGMRCVAMTCGRNDSTLPVDAL
jgi:hypothetical protein